ncbi:MAG TPA: division/cell wall cluster transcriptional repressor MraZ [Acidimicrobiia bacterium]|nr:division/cell wall cluster transcriptional repressor MraZ [Acidimicrobiia bacterium]
MFLGEHKHIVDVKGRVVMPSRFRPELERGLVVTKGQDRCLAVFPVERFNQEVDRLNRLPRTDRRTRNFARSLYGGASDLPLDAQGRLPLPAALRSYAGLERDVVVCGVGDRVEIWDAETYYRFQADNDDAFAQTDTALGEEGL